MDKQKIEKLEQKKQELLEQYRSVVKEIKYEKINGVDFIGKFIIFDETRHLYVKDQMVFDEGVVLVGMFFDHNIGEQYLYVDDDYRCNFSVENFINFIETKNYKEITQEEFISDYMDAYEEVERFPKILVNKLVNKKSK